MKGLIIVGAGGHASVVLQAAIRCGLNVVGLLDAYSNAKTLLHYPIFSDETYYLSPSVFEKYTYHVAIGDNEKRLKISQEILDGGGALTTIIDPSAIVACNVSMGVGSYVAPMVVINPFAKIGNAVIINTGAIIEHHCNIAHGVHIAPHATLCGNVVVHTAAFICASATIIPQKTVGERAILGAGAVLKKDLEAYTTFK